MKITFRGETFGEDEHMGCFKHFPGMTYDEIVSKVAREWSENMHPDSICLPTPQVLKAYLLETYDVFCKLGAIRAIYTDMAEKG